MTRLYAIRTRARLLPTTYASVHEPELLREAFGLDDALLLLAVAEAARRVMDEAPDYLIASHDRDAWGRALRALRDALAPLLEAER